ncbi:MAG: cardiolipin synthase B [Rhodoferax sp.]|nr:cardiolipin synthase B [Rhodoferax sp.]
MPFFSLLRHRIVIIVITILLTLVCAVIAFNFIGGEKRIEHHVSRQYALNDPQFSAQLGVLLGPPFLAGNRYRALRNGDQIFQPMLEAIRSAQKSITFETYIYWSGDIGHEFAAALAERASNGVNVHVLLDWVGSAKMDASLIKQMESAGVQVHRYHPPRWSDLGRINNRTHRKLLIVDGKTGFTGGVGIAQNWTGNAQDPDHWRDTHFEIEGPVVAQMQSVFMDNWIKVSGEVLHGENYFPTLTPVGDGGMAQMFSSSPSGGSESMALMYLFAIAAATHSIDLSASYFVPDELSIRALVAAMKRGVKLRIIVPGDHIDSDTVRSASRATWEPLLEAGALIAEYQPTMFHCKIMVIDSLLTSVGSTNFDNRSFRLNDEATLNIIDEKFARQQTDAFNADLQLAKPITLADWRARPMTEKLRNWLASLLASQL